VFVNWVYRKMDWIDVEHLCSAAVPVLYAVAYNIVSCWPNTPRNFPLPRDRDHGGAMGSKGTMNPNNVGKDPDPIIAPQNQDLPHP